MICSTKKTQQRGLEERLIRTDSQGKEIWEVNGEERTFKKTKIDQKAMFRDGTVILVNLLGAGSSLRKGALKGFRMLMCITGLSSSRLGGRNNKRNSDQKGKNWCVKKYCGGMITVK